MRLHRQGEFSAARCLYREHLESEPDDVGAWCLLGALEGQSEDHSGAEAAYRNALSISPNHAAALAGLGTSLLMQSRFGEAVDALSTVVKIEPDEPETRMHLAVAQLRAAETEQAAQTLAALVERWPEHARGRHTLGTILMQLGLPDQACRHFRAVVEIQGRQSPAALDLVRALLAANDLNQAEAELRSVMRAGDPAPEARILEGDLKRARGCLEEAAAAYGAALQGRANAPGALLGLAEIDRQRGLFEQGLERIEPLLSLDRPPGGALLLAARLLLDGGRYRDAADRIEGWLGRRDLGLSAREALQNLRGRALDELGEHEAAWDDWTASHRRQSGEFAGHQFRNAIEALRSAFDIELFERLGGGDAWDGPSPLLVVGAPGSGKSILEQILACHPAVRGAGELRELGTMTNRIAGLIGSAEPYPACIRDLSRTRLADLAADYAAAIRAYGGDATWVIDTQPTNFLHIGLHALLAPDARVVVCERDPLDTAWACYRRRFADRGLVFVTSPEGIADYLAGMRTLIGHWEAVCPTRILRVRYEDLVRGPSELAVEVLRHMDLEWDPACEDYAVPGAARLATPPTLREPVDDREIGRGAPYRDRFAVVERCLAGAGDDD